MTHPDSAAVSAVFESLSSDTGDMQAFHSGSKPNAMSWQRQRPHKAGNKPEPFCKEHPEPRASPGVWVWGEQGWGGQGAVAMAVAPGTPSSSHRADRACEQPCSPHPRAIVLQLVGEVMLGEPKLDPRRISHVLILGIISPTRDLQISTQNPCVDDTTQAAPT